MKVMVDKSQDMYFYTLDEFSQWSAENSSSKKPVTFKSRYLKGLGSSTADDFRKYFSDMENNLIQVHVAPEDNLEIVDLVFGKETGAADRRKVWLNLEDS